MTTIAWRDNEMAADDCCVGFGIQRSAKKIHELNDHCVIGVSGVALDCLHFVRWFKDQSEPLKYVSFRGTDDAPDFLAMVWAAGEMELWTEYCQPVPITHEPFYAIGSGATAAMGAMHMGANAEEAVRVASKVDLNTSAVVQVVKLKAQ